MKSLKLTAMLFLLPIMVPLTLAMYLVSFLVHKIADAVQWYWDVLSGVI